MVNHLNSPAVALPPPAQRARFEPMKFDLSLVRSQLASDKNAKAETGIPNLFETGIRGDVEISIFIIQASFCNCPNNMINREVERVSRQNT